MSDASTGSESRDAEALVAELTARRGVGCRDCGRAVCHHEGLMSIALGYQGTPRCLGCLARALSCEAVELRDRLFDYLRRRECHRTAWTWANAMEGFPLTALPGCLFPGATRGGGEVGSEGSGSLFAREREETGEWTDPREGGEDRERPESDEDWDAGDRSCGELVLELRRRLTELPSRSVLRLRACDAGVPEDLPAWCRLTGHRLVRVIPPLYWIQRKD